MPNPNDRRDGPEDHRERTGLEGAAGQDAGIIRPEEVEGGDELSIGGSPPSGAGGTKGSPAPTREEMDDS